MRPSPQEIRRRRLAVLALAVAALVAGAAVGAGGDRSEPDRAVRDGGAEDAPKRSGRHAGGVPEGVRAMPRTHRAGTLVILRFDGTSPPGYVLRVLRQRRAGGVILFRDNVTTPAALRHTTRRLQRAADGDALVSTDQEGGAVRRIPFAGPVPGQPALGTIEAVRGAARTAARQLRAHGVNLNLAPVADVASIPGSVVAARAFPGGTAAVAALTAASVRAYEGTGVAPTLKHFPGIGGTTVNTDDAAATIRRPARELGAVDLPPFRAGIAAGAPVVMASHALYPGLDSRDIASQSEPILEGLLRDRLGFRGVIATDSLEAAAVRRRGGPAAAAVASVRAGADLLVTTGKGSYLDVLRALVREARRDPAFDARLTESAARVLELRRRLSFPSGR